jgi:site-specific recombinase XerD
VDELGRSVVIHSTRHTFASQLGRAGVGLVQAQRLLGHSTPELTAQVYTHLGIEDLRAAVDKIEPATRRRAKRGA